MLRLSDREEISRGLAEGLPFKEIAARLGRDPSVVSRDVARHGGRVRYRAAAADGTARVSRERPKAFAVERSARLRAVVHRQLRGGWSPASIAGRLPIDYPSDQACRVSHEAIYQWVYAQSVSRLARELINLRTGRTARRGGRRPPPAPRIREPRYLDERPAEVAGRGATTRSRPKTNCRRGTEGVDTAPTVGWEELTAPPPPRRITLRLEPTLYDQVHQAARRADKSIQVWCVNALSTAATSSSKEK
jgi:IS30 family transposase